MSVFDDQAKKYDQWYKTKLGRHVDETETRCAFELLKPGPGMKVLDVGCGTGNFSIKLARLGCVVTGIDISKEMLSVAAEKARMEGFKVDFQSMDVTAMKFADESFDIVISMAALEFMKDHSDAIDEMFRVLKKGGYLLVGTINRLSPWGELYLKAGEDSGSIFHHAGFLTMEELKSFRPDKLVSTSECLFIGPDADEKDIDPDKENTLMEPGKGGFLCAMWRKRPPARCLFCP